MLKARVMPATPPRPAGSAMTTKAAPALPGSGRCRLQPRQDEGRPRSRGRYPPADDRPRSDRPDRHLMIDANQVWEVDAGDRLGQQTGLCQALLHRGADQPGRRCRAPQDPRGHRAGQGRDRRDVPEPHHVQAVHHAEGRHRHRADRFMPHGRAERGAGGSADGREIWLPVWPHAGGVGLCEYVQHLSMIDYVAYPAPRKAG
jgi:hypothetical protein